MLGAFRDAFVDDPVAQRFAESQVECMCSSFIFFAFLWIATLNICDDDFSQMVFQSNSNAVGVG